MQYPDGITLAIVIIVKDFIVMADKISKITNREIKIHETHGSRKRRYVT